jgi:hypothetical protein
MNSLQTLKIFELTAKYFQNEADAKTFVGELEQLVENKFADKEKLLATKEDIFSLKEEMLNIKGDLQKQIAESKADTIKWMFVYWSGSILATLGGLFAILKLFFGK